MQRFIVESLDHPQAGRTRDAHEVLPFLVAFEEVDRQAGQLFGHTSVFVHLTRSGSWARHRDSAVIHPSHERQQIATAEHGLRGDRRNHLTLPFDLDQEEALERAKTALTDD